MKHRHCIWKICFENLGRKQSLLLLKRDSINILQQVFLSKGQYLLGNMWSETCSPRSQCSFLKYRALLWRDTRIFAQFSKDCLPQARPWLQTSDLLWLKLWKLKIVLNNPNEDLEWHNPPVAPSTRTAHPCSATRVGWIHSVTNIPSSLSWKNTFLKLSAKNTLETKQAGVLLLIPACLAVGLICSSQGPDRTTLRVILGLKNNPASAGHV